MNNIFNKHSLLKHAASIAAYLPNSKLFFAKRKEDSELKKLINGLSGESSRVESSIVDLFEQKDIRKTTRLIDEWESALGIPDGIFLANGTLEERRLHVLIKFTMSVQTTEDFEELGRLLGYHDIEIKPFIERELLPYNVPFIPWNGPTSRFISVVRATNILPAPPPYNVPFDVGSDPSIIIKLFEILKPANTKFIYEEK